jgi:putative tricarboxylic transport membrane protein
LADRILAACTLLLSGIYLYATYRLPAMDIGDPLGPKAFPYLLGILFAASAVLLFIESLRLRPPAAADPAPPTASRPRAVLGVAAATALLFALLEPLGYLIAVTAYLFALFSWLHPRRPIASALVAVLFALGSYALFVKLLGVTLAKGLFSF